MEQLGDRPAVDALVEEAFGRASVARLVQLIRVSEHWIPELSLVAERGGRLVGHVLMSTADLLTAAAPRRILLLSPLAVRPDAQGRGIGRALVEAAIGAAHRTGFGVLVLEGDPNLYARFGFRPAAELGIERPSHLIPEAAWQALPLAAYDSGLRGRVNYPSAFWETGSVGR